MKRVLQVLALVGVAGVLMGALRLVEDFIVLPDRAYADLPAHPKYVRGIAYDSTAKTPVYSTTGSTWRRVANVAGGQNSSIASGAWLMDGGSITFETAFGAAPVCLCNVNMFDGGSIQQVTCPSTTTTLTPQLNGGAGIGSELIQYVCVGRL